MFAPIVVNHLMVTIVKIVVILKCSIDMAILAIVQFEGKTKEYAFLTALDTIKEGARVKDKRYDKPFTVKRTDFHFSTTYNGYPLKWITSGTIEWIVTPSTRFNKEKNKMEKRNISISFEQAREWYHNDCGILRRLALQAFTEEELDEPITFDEVLLKMRINSVTVEMLHTNKCCSESLEKMRKKAMVHIKLKIVAEYLNKGWKPQGKGRRFFIAQGTSYSPSAVDLENGFYVNSHETVRYPGVVYFRTQEDAIKAFNMLKDELTVLYR